MEEELKKKLQNDFVGVRKAFLSLDKNHRGKITAIDFAHYLRYGFVKQEAEESQAELDYTLLEHLIRIKCH